MTQKRINPETGVYEENNGFLGFDIWQTIRDKNNNQKRINPETGKFQKSRDICPFLPLGEEWVDEELK